MIHKTHKKARHIWRAFLCLRYFLHVSVKVHGIHCPYADWLSDG